MIRAIENGYTEKDCLPYALRTTGNFPPYTKHTACEHTVGYSPSGGSHDYVLVKIYD